MNMLPPEDRELVWRALIQGKYEVQVRSRPSVGYNAVLNIYEGGKLRHSQPVGLAFGTAFEVRPEDEARWKKMAEHFIHSLAKEQA